MKIIQVISFSLILLFILATNCPAQQQSTPDSFPERIKYINIDGSRTSNPTRKGKAGGWFGLGFVDANNDGFTDIVSGAWLYKNPAGNMEGSWEKHLIGRLPICDHKMGSQGYIKCDINNDKIDEFVLTSEGIFSISIPENPENGLWPYTVIQEDTSNGEGLVAADFDGDGDLDIASALNDGKERHAIYWWENLNGSGKSWNNWFIGRTIHDADRFAVGDYNEDGKLDIAISEERYPGLEKDANLYWYNNNLREEWTRQLILTAFTLNNLSSGDFDLDGKIDIITTEHLGPDLKLLLIRNLGNAKFEEIVLDTGKENHLGTILNDLDHDGDMDIIGIAWFNYKNVQI